MPWRTANVVEQRIRFVLEAQDTFLSFKELCERYGISRPTGYLWLERYEAGEVESLKDRSHRPRSSPNATPEWLQREILALRKRRRWGARKIWKELQDRFGRAPHADTIHAVLRRAGLVHSGKPRRQRGHPGPPISKMEEPNEVWCADFKGHFKTRDGRVCYPLTVTDGYSRYLLECRGLNRPSGAACEPWFRSLFRTYGLPQRIRTDNGKPFAEYRSVGKLSRLSVWWVKLGIRPEQIERGKPQQNGRHERMHRTLKAEATRPPSPTLNAQQARFNRFRKTFNEERPHDALGLDTPSRWYRPSERAFPEGKLSEIEYPSHFELRKVAGDKTIKWLDQKVFVSNLLKREYIGFEEVADGEWSVYFGPVHLGWFDERDYRIMDRRGPARRR
jgi:putative transposase